MPEPLTSRQREILEYLRFRQKIRSYPPTVREIGEAVGLSSSSTVQNHLNTLERKGYIRRDPTKSRTIEVVDVDEMQAKLSKVVAVPLVGRVAAGQPILAEENIDDHLAPSAVPEGASREGRGGVLRPRSTHRSTAIWLPTSVDFAVRRGARDPTSVCKTGPS